LADAGQRSRTIIPGDDPGDQQPPERRPESDASIDVFSCAVMQEPRVVEQPAWRLNSPQIARATVKRC
jgi:hypothetical protein